MSWPTTRAFVTPSERASAWSRTAAVLTSRPSLGIAESPICCGSAGIYNLVQPDAATELGDRKARLIAPLHAEVVATGNPGCILQLQVSLRKINYRIPVLHTIQLLDASIRGLPLDALD